MVPTMDERIAQFCQYCDFRDSYGPCKTRFGNHDQQRYVKRNQCGWSNVQGVPMSNVTAEYCQIRSETHPHPFQRTGIDAFLIAIEKERELGNVLYDADTKTSSTPLRFQPSASGQLTAISCNCKFFPTLFFYSTQS